MLKMQKRAKIVRNNLELVFTIIFLKYIDRKNTYHDLLDASRAKKVLLTWQASQTYFIGCEFVLVVLTQILLPTQIYTFNKTMEKLTLSHFPLIYGKFTQKRPVWCELYFELHHYSSFNVKNTNLNENHY